MRLKDALEETFAGWREDLDSAWRGVLGCVELGFDAVDASLTVEAWEPIFPARRCGGGRSRALRPAPMSFERSTASRRRTCAA